MTEQEPPIDANEATLAEEPTGQEPRDHSLTIDERFEILKNERRRRVLESLSEANQTVTLSDLADNIAAIENDTSVKDVTSSERKRVYVALYQFHLPKMDRMGVIEYNKDRGEVSLTEEGRALYQAHEGETNQPGYLALLGLCACVLGVIGLVAVVLTQAWILGTVILGIQTAMLSVKLIAERRQ